MLTSRERYKIWYGGIAGGSFIAVTQLITRDVFHWSQRVAIACFAFALPIATLFATWPNKYRQKAPQRPLRTLLDELGRTCGVVFTVGVSALFWSLGFAFALVFIVSCTVALMMYVAVTRYHEKQEKESAIGARESSSTTISASSGRDRDRP